MEKYDISIIIPCYNAEDGISRCIDSVINQTLGFENIELILVDDKSKDNTRNVIEKYSDKYNNIKAIFLDENSGFAGKPRNIGIKHANADYIMFMDSDDEYDSEICEIFFNEIRDEKADIVTCNHINITSNGTFYSSFDYKNGKELDDKVLIENEDVKYFKIGVIWCSIFKKSIITKNNIIFPENQVTEDLWFMINYLLQAKKAVYLNKYYGYIRYVHTDSTSHYTSIEKHNGAYDLLEECLELFPEDYDLSYRFESSILYGYIQLLTTNIISSNPEGSYNFLKRLREIENKMNFNKKLMMPFNIINWFVMRGNFKVAFFLLKSLYIYIYKNDFFYKLYKKILLYRTIPEEK